MRRKVASTIVAAVLVALTSLVAFGAGEGIELAPANTNIENTPSLQRGAKYFVNYCLGCHSAQYVRYNKLAEGLMLDEQQLIDNLIFSDQQPFDTMTNAMRAADAERWFGTDPPDLSLISRARGVDYIYNFLRGFYVDETTATGANNIVLPNTAMPHVLWELQGLRRPIYEQASEDAAPVITGFEVVRPGLLSEAEFDQVARDIVNFLDYIGEPMKLERRSLGIRVIGFLLVFLLIAWMLKKEIWKDVA
jgi:ubiquinol-cytochrome c reductase cytochrome c1 subunit